jgi:hypothetical protein
MNFFRFEKVTIFPDRRDMFKHTAYPLHPLPTASEASRRKGRLSRVFGKKVGGKYKKRPVKKSVVYWLIEFSRTL